MKTLSIIAIIFVILSLNSSAQIPRTISFQGVLADAQGNLVPDGNHQLQIVLYDQATNGNQVFVENQTVPVVKGIFNVIIGSVAVLPQLLSFDRAYFLGVSVDGGSELTPRTALTSVPYALRAERANIAESLSPNAAVVTHVNNQSGDVTLLGAGGTTVTNNGNAFTISSTGTGGTGIQSVQNTDGTVAIQNPNGPVATIGIADGSVTPEKINPSGAVSGQALIYNGSSVKWITPSVGGSGVSSINNTSGALTLAASGGATVSTNGQTITIHAGSGSGGTGIQGVQNTDNTLDITNPGGPTATINVKNQGITTTKLADGSVTNAKIPAGQVVKSINTLKDDVTLAAGSNVTLTPSGNTLTIAASGGGGTSSWATNGNNISNANTGNVGIGTSNPTAKLDVANGYLRAQDGANTPPTSGEGVELVSVASSHIGYLISYDRSNSHHRELDIDGSPLVLNVSSGGNVGIGVSNPTTSKLEIAGQDGLMITGYEPFITLRDGNAGNARGRIQSLNGDIVFDPESFIGGNAAMVIKNSSGNVGIGIIAPQAKLHVVNVGGTGVLGVSTGLNARGVTGEVDSKNSWGVYGHATGVSGVGVYGESVGVGGIGVVGISSSGYAMYCNGKFYQAYGSFEANPTSTTWTTNKPATVKLNNGAKVKLFTEESTEIYFTDYGEGQLMNGKTHITLDAKFVQTVTIDQTHPLQVFVQLNDDCKGVFTTNKSATGFDVVEHQGGTSNARFNYRIVCKRKYYEDERLATEEEDIRYNTNVLETVWPEVIAKGKAEREKMEKMMSEHAAK